VILCDVNVLLYAFRKDAIDHDKYLAWLEEVVNGDAAYGVSPQVLASLIRLSTHPRVFARPSGLDEALAFSRTLIEQPNCVVVSPGPRHWDLFARLCADAQATGNLVPDAWFAAMAVESGCEWITTDRDYARFKGLRWRPPF
jgi:toxin-antitoxin system PIN domain toxin